jgi:hypothetical protein
MAETLFPTEKIDLPSKGWYYPSGHPLSGGKVELKYMTAQHEDILTSRNLISKGIVLDKLMEALIADPTVRYDDLLIGDKNALIVAARILGYGKMYEAHVTCPKCGDMSVTNIDLEKLTDKELDFKDGQKGKNQFSYELPISKKIITFKLLTHRDVKNAEAELEKMKKVTGSETSTEITTRMRYSILTVDGEGDPEVVRKFISTMLARDAMAWRNHAKEINPDVDLTFNFDCSKCGFEDRLEVPIDITFFWPNAGV